jgi:hypothetical protein
VAESITPTKESTLAFMDTMRPRDPTSHQGTKEDQEVCGVSPQFQLSVHTPEGNQKQNNKLMKKGVPQIREAQSPSLEGSLNVDFDKPYGQYQHDLNVRRTANRQIKKKLRTRLFRIEVSSGGGNFPQG